VVQLHREIDSIHAAGAEVHVIGNGAPMFIAGFREQTGWRGPVYTDPSLDTYRAAQLERGVTNTLDPRSLVGAFKAFRGGQRQGRTQGDAWQQGGTLVIATDGRVKFHHISKRPDDQSTATQILAALR
jgi:alkyl-hydroperoxide reductase/thiol specific antioxidant family protein